MTQVTFQQETADTEHKIDSNMADNFKALRLILERQQSHAVSYDEAQDIGESLLTFFTLLAEDDETGVPDGRE